MLKKLKLICIRIIFYASCIPVCIVAIIAEHVYDCILDIYNVIKEIIAESKKITV